jgi:hypothetical protein
MKHLKTLMGLLVLLGALSCTKTRITSDGTLTFTLSPAYDLVEVTKSNVSDYVTLPQASEFALVIKDEAGKETWSGLLSEWDPTTQLLAGDYVVEASYGALEEEGFDKPYFFGTAEFTIKGGESTEVPVEVALANTIVKINCNDMFKNYFVDYSFEIKRGNALIATISKDETRGVFVDGFKLNISGVFTNEGGVETKFDKEYTNLDAATAYTMQLDLMGVGGQSVTISFNDDTETVTLDDVELND